MVYKLNTKINIGILDYGVGNITSLINCLNSLGQKTKIISNSKDLKGITVLILPGVGAMNFAMQNIKKRKLDVLIKKIFFSPPQWCSLPKLCLSLIYKIAQNSIKRTYFIWFFLGVATIQERPLLARVRYLKWKWHNFSLQSWHSQNIWDVWIFCYGYFGPQ